MNRSVNQKKNRLIVALAAVAAVIAILTLACAVYISDYYRADAAAIEAFPTVGGFEEILLDGMIVLVPREGEAKDGFIFYPGGKVEYTAYLPLMRALADRGVLCVLTKMPANLAFLDIHAADRVRQAYPEVERWYIGGHSLGGSAASYCLAAHPDCYEGLVLLAAYTTEDFSSAEIKALSLFGTEDGILNRSDRYDSCRPNLPESTVEIKIEGGCHSYFGCYGMQEGDGVPSITAEEQINFTADAIRDFIFDKDT